MEKRMRKLFANTTLALALLGAADAHAGPAEDYAAGSAAYRVGDVRGAIAKLRPGADAGDARSQALLGSLLERDEDAVHYLKLAAEQGNADGAYGLAGKYAAGEGVKKSPDEARRWMVRAAAAGHPDARNALAQAFLSGGLGVSEEERRSPGALEWLRPAAEAGFLPAMDRMVLAYRKGEFGLAVDQKLAADLEAKAKAIRGANSKGRARATGKDPRG